MALHSLGWTVEKKATATKPGLTAEDRVRIKETYDIAEKYAEQIWPNWNKAPWSLVLVTDDYEYLVRHTKSPQDFKALAYDSLLESQVYFRKRSFDAGFLATFFVNGTPTMIVGPPTNTGKSSSEWVVALLHEHFHQLQYSQPDYSASVDSLNLSGGDKSGMWMLNYPFPYDSSKVDKQFRKLCQSILKTLEAREENFSKKLAEYKKTREELKNILNEKDYKYFSFQIWQEGIARYVELKIAKLLSTDYKPSPEFESLPDYTPFSQVAQKLEDGIMNDLMNMSFKEYKRVAFYSLGAAEALILDKNSPKWEYLYFRKKFFIDQYSD